MTPIIDNTLSIQAVTNMLKASCMEPDTALKLSSLALDIKNEHCESVAADVLGTPPAGTTSSTPDDCYTASESSMPPTPTHFGFSELLDPAVIRLDDSNWHQAASMAVATSGMCTDGIKMEDAAMAATANYWPVMAASVTKAMEAFSQSPTMPNIGQLTCSPDISNTLSPVAGCTLEAANEMPLFMGFSAPMDFGQYQRSLLPPGTSGLAQEMAVSAPFIDPKEIIPCPILPQQHAQLLVDTPFRDSEFDRAIEDATRGSSIVDHSPRLVSAFSAYYESGHFTELPPPGTPVLRELSNHSGLPVLESTVEMLAGQPMPVELCFEPTPALHGLHQEQAMFIQHRQQQQHMMYGHPHHHQYSEVLAQHMPGFDLGLHSMCSPVDNIALQAYQPHHISPVMQQQQQQQQQQQVPQQQQTQRTSALYAHLKEITSPERQAAAAAAAAAQNAHMRKRAVHSTTASGRIGKRMIRSDDKKREWICPECHRAFMRSEHLKRHVSSVHTDLKPFTCHEPGCGKMFARSDNLQQHHRTHLRKAMRPTKKQRAPANSTSTSNMPVGGLPSSSLLQQVAHAGSFPHNALFLAGN